MIIELSIRNFGSIREKLTISFEAMPSKDLDEYYIVEPIKGLRLLKLVYIYGPNASGKTTILRALQFMRELVTKPADNKTKLLNFRPFLFDGKSQNEASEIALSFVAVGIRYDYTVTFNVDGILAETLHYVPKNRSAELFSRYTNEEDGKVLLSFGSTIKINIKDAIILEGNTIGNNSVFGALSKSNVIVEALNPVYKWFTDYLFDLIEPKTNLERWTKGLIDRDKACYEDVEHLINSADLQITGMRITKQEEVLDDNLMDFIKRHADAEREVIDNLKMKEKITLKKFSFKHTVNLDGRSANFYLDESRESNGSKRYFGLSGPLTLLIKNGGVLGVDEIETSLHPDLMKQLILYFLVNAKNSQMLLTTHNYFLLEERDILRNDAIYLVDKKDTGATEVYSVADFDSSVLRKTTSLVNLYRSGRLGAKPNPKDVFALK